MLAARVPIAPSPADPFWGYQVKSRVAPGVFFSTSRRALPGLPGSPHGQPPLGLAQSRFSNIVTRYSLTLVNHLHIPGRKMGCIVFFVFPAWVWLILSICQRLAERWPRLTQGAGPSPAPGSAPAAEAERGLQPVHIQRRGGGGGNRGHSDFDSCL